MEQTGGITCRIGWHRWQAVAEKDMLVRTCTTCGRRRYHGTVSGKDEAATTGWGPGYTGGGGLGGDGG